MVGIFVRGLGTRVQNLKNLFVKKSYGFENAGHEKLNNFKFQIPTPWGLTRILVFSLFFFKFPFVF